MELYGSAYYTTDGDLTLRVTDFLADAYTSLELTRAGLEPAIFGSEDQRLIH